MINYLKKLYRELFPQWVIYQCHSAVFKITETNTFEYAHYIILNKGNKYKLKTSGYYPEKHQMYGEVLNKIAKLNGN